MSAAFSWRSDASTPGTAGTVGTRDIRSRDASYSPNESMRSTLTARTEALSKPRSRGDAPSPVPPIGTYNLPTTFDENSYERRTSASFISIGRRETFFDNGTMYHKNNREADSKNNVGPGSYNLAFNWSPGSNDTSVSSATSPENRSDSPVVRECCLHRPTPVGQYERTWMNDKAVAPLVTPRERQQNKEELQNSITAVQDLPSY